MSEMFTKCNGFIVSGDPLVYADSATMTGDGTVASPFGVNKMDMFVQAPLFTGTSGEGDNTSAYIGWNNETVLFENNEGVTGGTLNEAAWNFNKIGIQMTGALNSNQYFEEIPLSGKMLCFMSTIGADAAYHFTPSKMFIDNNNNFTFSSFDYYTSTAGSDNTLFKNGEGHLKVIKIIGINRKA